MRVLVFYFVLFVCLIFFVPDLFEAVSPLVCIIT